MAKQKKAGKHMNKETLANIIQNYFADTDGRRIPLKTIFRDLKLTTHPLKMLCIDVLEDMVWDDYLVRVADNAYKLNGKGHVQEGTFQRKATGKNAFLPDDGGDSVFVAERNSMNALNGDRVKVQFMARRRNHIKEAIVIEIVKHVRDTFVGKMQVSEDFAFLIPDGNVYTNDIFIPRSKICGAKNGDKAVVRVTNWPTTGNRHISGEVIDVLGPMGENNTEMHAILAQYDLPYSYPEEVERAANEISEEIPQEEIERREDMRSVNTFTIDPHDAKDFDDALSIRPLEAKGQWEVGVHIADVSHYVKEGSVIDKEAVKRATSVYLVDRTIPMLPERLCNFICSLRPDEDKLAYSVVFNMDEQGNILSHRLVHTVIRSNRRYAYEEVQDVLEAYYRNPDDDVVKAEKYSKELITLDRMAKALREKRFNGGAVNFDREELRFDIDEKGKPLRCYFKKSKDANKLVEEFMLLANRTVAEMIGKVKKGAKPKTLPYRVHDNPDPSKLETLANFISRFGYKVKVNGTKGETSRSLNALLADCNGSNEQKLIETIALRSMAKAKYTTYNIGHFGLAFDHYTHFTSPIRRYPDTIVHRLLTAYQEGAPSANRDKIEKLCEHSSEMEQLAANAERDSIKYKAVEYLSDKIGEQFDAHISGVASYGLYCEIDENHCEGLIPIRELNEEDYFDFDEKNYCLIGRRTHVKYQLGDPIRIEVEKADLERRRIDFLPA